MEAAERSPASPGPVPGIGPNQLVTGRRGYRYLYNVNDRYIGASLAAYGEFSGEESDLLESLLGEGNFVIEVGANIGALSLGIAGKIGRTGWLFAFEPQRVIFQMLCANVALNGLSNVDCLCMALGAAPGSVLVPEFDFSRPSNFGGLSVAGHKQGRPVPVGTLDGFRELPRLDLIKIDVEGMELDVLRGGQKLIARHRPMIYLENDRPEKSAPLIAMLAGLAYDLYWHLPPMFRANNALKNPVNLFSDLISVNMIALPRERPMVPLPLRKVSGPLDRP